MCIRDSVYTGPWVSLTELRVFGVGDRVTSVDEVTFDEVLISPNPATNFVTIQGAENFEVVSVFDQSGRRVIQQKINNNLESLDISELQSGLYIVKFEGADKPNINKLIKL